MVAGPGINTLIQHGQGGVRVCGVYMPPFPLSVK